MATLNKLDKIIKVFYSKSGHVEPSEVHLACNYLNNSGVIAVPTDTLYGIAARADNSKALDRIYKIKGRESAKPLAVCVGNLEQLSQVADQNSYNINLLKTLLPGPLTVVLKRSQTLNKDLNPNFDKVGVRIPDHSFIRSISQILDCPLALTSANKSGNTSPLNIEDFSEIWDDLDAIFDLGPLRSSLPFSDSPAVQRLRCGSTVVDLTEERQFKILREGCALNRTTNVLHRFGFIRKK